MSKITLPKKVAEAIDKMRKEGWGDEFLVNFHEFIDIEYKPTRPLDSYIYNVSKYLSESGDNRLNYIKAIISGYEVDKNFVVGDWVKIENELGEILSCGRVDTTAFNDVIFNHLKEDLSIRRVRLGKNIVEEMTEKEIKKEKERWKWSEWGRKLNEYKPYDLVKLDNGYLIYEVHDVTKPLEIEISSDQYITKQFVFKSNVEMICPAEYRVDMEEDE